MATLLPITGEIRDYAWGAPGGIARAFGQPDVQTPQAELWLGAHPSAPSRIADGGDLQRWEDGTGVRLPYLLKVLAAAAPLSLQAHPTPEQAALGFERENALGIDIAAPDRNYRDGSAKPELIVAVTDGFEALCGFRPVDDAVAALRALGDAAPIQTFADLVAGPDGLRRAVLSVLRREPGTDDLVAAIATAGAADPLISRLAAHYPGDPGLAVAVLLNHVTLAAGESLWLPAGNIHAYLTGTGVELMGPSDNVLRGGFTPKHVDVEELGVVLDFTGAQPPRLLPVAVAPGAASYRPATHESGSGVPFELIAVTADTRIQTPGASIGVVLAGSWDVSAGGEHAHYERGDTFLVAAGGVIDIAGTGRLFLATASATNAEDFTTSA